MIAPSAWARDHGYEVVEALGGSGSDWVARMRSADGDDHLVKRASRRVRASRGEARCMGLWEGIPGVPRLLGWDAERGILVREWVEGRPVEDPLEHAEAAGRALARLHVPAPVDVQPLGDWTASVGRRFRASESAPSERALRELERAPGDGTALLHGDYRPGNLLVAADGLAIIDPYGYRGDPSFDLATYVVASYGCDRDETLRRLRAGYGDTPSTLESTITWFSTTHAGFLRSIESPDPTLDAWIDGRRGENLAGRG